MSDRKYFQQGAENKMNFMDAVKQVVEGKVMRRQNWTGMMKDNKRLIVDKYGMLKTISFQYVERYEPTVEDVLSEDWVEVEKQKYEVQNVYETDGIQYFVLRTDFSFGDEDPLRRDEMLTLSHYLNITFSAKAEAYKAALSVPTSPVFDYDYHKCPVCEGAITYRPGNQGKCEIGCIEYDVDPQGENVSAQLFDGAYDEDSYLLNLEPNGWNRENNDMKVNMRKFQESVRFWRENNRYLKRLETLKSGQV
jgi:hypothetical protein